MERNRERERKIFRDTKIDRCREKGRERTGIPELSIAKSHTFENAKFKKYIS